MENFNENLILKSKLFEKEQKIQNLENINKNLKMKIYY